MLSRIATGTFLVIIMAWIGSCTNDVIDKDVLPMSGTSGTKVVTAIPQHSATTTTTLPILVAVTTTSTTTTTFITPAKPTIDEELRVVAERLENILTSEYGYYTRGPEIV